MTALPLAASASADPSALLLPASRVSSNLLSSGKTSGFVFVFDYDGTLTPAQNSRREPDYLVRVPNAHPLFGVGSAYFRQPPGRCGRSAGRCGGGCRGRLSQIAFHSVFSKGSFVAQFSGLLSI